MLHSAIRLNTSVKAAGKPAAFFVWFANCFIVGDFKSQKPANP
jgi:hypothetical protein